MSLTTAQLQALKAAVAADPTLGQIAHTPDNAGLVADAFNQDAAGPFVVWRSGVPADSVFNAITWASMTPNDAVPTDTALNVQVWSARSLACQGKQFNLQTLLTGKATVACGLARIRNAFQDALQNVPSGNNGNAKDAGWAAVMAAFQRNASRAEKLYASGTGTAASPADLGWEGTLAYTDVVNAWQS